MKAILVFLLLIILGVALAIPKKVLAPGMKFDNATVCKDLVDHKGEILVLQLDSSGVETSIRCTKHCPGKKMPVSMCDGAKFKCTCL